MAYVGGVRVQEPDGGAEVAASGPDGVRREPAVITPDAVGIDLDVATIGSRGAAYLVDLLIVGLGLTLLAVAQASMDVLGFLGPLPDWVGITLALLLVFALQFGYPIAFETLWRGRTPGKALLGLRVVTVEGAPIGLRHAAIRAVFGVIELNGTFGTVAIVTSFASSRGQRLGDLVAGTFVVRERRAAGTPTAESFPAPPGAEAYVAMLDVTAVRGEDYATAREVLRRAESLPEPVARSVVDDVARVLVVRVRPAPPADMDAHTFLRCVAAAVQRRRVAAPDTASAPPPARATPPPPAGPPPAPHTRAPPPQEGGGGFAPPS